MLMHGETQPSKALEIRLHKRYNKLKIRRRALFSIVAQSVAASIKPRMSAWLLWSGRCLHWSVGLINYYLFGDNCYNGSINQAIDG